MKALQRLREGQPVYGLFQTYPQASIAEIAVWSGYDFIITDCEHGVVDEAAQLNVFSTIAGSEAFSMVRIRPHDAGAVARYLDLGVDGLLVPNVRTVDEARQIAFEATRRWTGGLRLDRYGRESAQRTKPMIIVLIESMQGVENANGILALDGIDGAIIGVGDLSLDRGHRGDFTMPGFLAAVNRVEDAARTHGKILGAKPYGEMTVAALLARGYRLIIVGRDVNLFRDSLAGALRVAKASGTAGEGR